MRIRKKLMMGIVGSLLLILVGCGAEEKAEKKLTDELITPGISEKEDFLVVESDYVGMLNVLVKENGGVVLEKEINSVQGIKEKLYSLEECEKDKSYEYTLEINSDKDKVVKTLVYSGGKK